MSFQILEPTNIYALKNKSLKFWQMPRKQMASSLSAMKYHIEITNSFWDNISNVESIMDCIKYQERINQEKDNSIKFLIGIDYNDKVLVNINFGM